MKSCSVELVYFSSCPNVGFAGENIREALVEVGRDDRWSEWDQEGTGIPAHYKAFSSPTVLVNGQDGLGRSCRAGGAPSANRIAKAIRDNG